MRNLADLPHHTSKPVLHRVLSLSAISLCIPRVRKRAEVRKRRKLDTIKSTAYALTNRSVFFQHWQARGNHNQVVSSCGCLGRVGTTSCLHQKRERLHKAESSRFHGVRWRAASDPLLSLGMKQSRRS